MNEYFNKINNTLFKNLKGNEILKTSVWGENSQFIRVNGAKVRQTGIVNDLTFNIKLLNDKKQVSCSSTITVFLKMIKIFC